MKKKKVFIVEMICEVRKQVTVECDDENMARESPFDYAIDETEIDQIDWRVVSVKEPKP